MKRALLALLAGCALAIGAASCGNGVDTDVPAPTPTPSGTETPTPTGTPTETPSPIPTPTPAGLNGDPWTTTATPATDTCAFVLTVAYGNMGVATIGVATTGMDLYFDIGLGLDPNVAVVEAPNGTVDAGGNFTQDFTYCTFNGASTYKYVGTWTGTFAGDNLSFDSTLTERLYIRNGDYRATCGADVTPANAAYGDCSSSGVSFAVHGDKQ